MLRLSRKADYALIALGHLAEREGTTASAREIAAACKLPLALLMRILKRLHQHGILTSVRGSAGGYRLGIDLADVSLFDLTEIVERAEVGCNIGLVTGQPSRKLALHGAAQALQYRLGRFMREISVADLVLPGRRIDVPLESIGINKQAPMVGEPRS